jgi:hypothetical protein
MSVHLKVVVYYRARPSEPEASAVALSAQRDAVASWTSERSAVVFAEFTEAEDGGKARPQLGKALALCRREDARLVVARTNPIGSGEEFGSLYGNDISGIRCERLTQPVGTVVYLRTRPSHGVESESHLVSQREAIAEWLSNRSTVLIAEYIETEEDDRSDRPALGAAVDRCLQEGNGTTLLVGTLAPIGNGPVLQIPSTRVPIEVAWTPPPEQSSIPTPDDIALPWKAPGEIALFFDPTDDHHLSVYLCNPRAEPLSDVRVSSIGVTTHGPSGPDGSGSLLSTSVSRKELGAVPPRTGRFVESYDPFWDGDFVTSYQVIFRTPDGMIRTFGTVIGTGGPGVSFMELHPLLSASLDVPSPI